LGNMRETGYVPVGMSLADGIEGAGLLSM
jgi:hypothetical protein